MLDFDFDLSFTDQTFIRVTPCLVWFQRGQMYLTFVCLFLFLFFVVVVDVYAVCETRRCFSVYSYSCCRCFVFVFLILPFCHLRSPSVTFTFIHITAAAGVFKFPSLCSVVASVVKYLLLCVHFID